MTCKVKQCIVNMSFWDKSIQSPMDQSWPISSNKMFLVIFLILKSFSALITFTVSSAED